MLKPSLYINCSILMCRTRSLETSNSCVDIVSGVFRGAVAPPPSISGMDVLL